jgi:hypothetical protein
VKHNEFEEMQKFIDEWEERVEREMGEGRHHPYAPEPLTDEDAQELSEHTGLSPEEVRRAHDVVCVVAEELELTDVEGRMVWDVRVLNVAMKTERYKRLRPEEQDRVDEALVRTWRVL